MTSLAGSILESLHPRDLWIITYGSDEQESTYKGVLFLTVQEELSQYFNAKKETIFSLAMVVI